MEQLIVVSVETSVFKGNNELEKTLISYAVHHDRIHSDLAIETLQLIMDVVEFFAVTISIPLIASFINSKKIIVKFEGFELTGNWKTVLKELCKDTSIKEMFIAELRKKSIDVNGQSASAVAFIMEANKLLEELELEKHDEDPAK